MAELGDKALILPAHRAAIGAVRPDLDGAPMVLRADGWDCLAIEVAGTVIFKVPHHDEACARLVREPKSLDLIRPHTALALPEMVLHRSPLLMSEHGKIPGEAVDPARYDALPDAVRAALSEDLAAFFAAAHSICAKRVREADCDALRPWPAPDTLVARLAGRVGHSVMAMAREAAARHAQHGPDAIVFGQFDTHGWNMAFDPVWGRLNGLFDFAGAGIRPLHRDLSYLFFVSPDLAARVMALYPLKSGRNVHPRRAADAHLYLRVIELADALAQGDQIPRFEAALAEYYQILCGF